MQAKNFQSWLKSFVAEARLLNERRVVVLSGSEPWALALLATTILRPDEGLNSEKNSCFIYGDSTLFPVNVDEKRFQEKLGSECNHLIFVDKQFRIDALAALSGTVKAGGILFIVIADLTLKKQQSHFVARFFTLLKTTPRHAIIDELKPEASVSSRPVKKAAFNSQVALDSEKDDITAHLSLAYSCATAEQLLAVNAIEKVARGHRKRPLVLTADRGRGKSSALAIACAQLLQQAKLDNKLHIIVTAPNSQSLNVFFHQLVISLPGVNRQKDRFDYAGSCVEFMPVDQLLKYPPQVSLLLVDEAAAIPVYLLEQLLTVYHRIVFSSTVHGYEGAGRGFTLKFQQRLTALCPQWRALHLREPIRWGPEDPLEQFVFDACLLNSELEQVSLFKTAVHSSGQGTNSEANEKINFASLLTEVITPDKLMTNEPLLRQVFSILVTAHYQTKPSDLKLLLDNPKVTLVCLKRFDPSNQSTSIVAVALLLSEGLVKDISAVQNNQRRLRNNFLPQSLLTHCGFTQAFDYNYLRIMRIAVHPQLQQQGIGRHLLVQIEQLAFQKKVDFIGASFGLNIALLSFWLTAKMQVTRIGFTKDKASGEHSVMVLKAINSTCTNQVTQLNYEFFRSFDFLLADEYKALNANVVLLLFTQQNEMKTMPLTPQDLANVYAFAQGKRLYSNCAHSLSLWLKQELVANKTLGSRPETLALISRLMQKHSIEQLCQQYSFTGKQMLEQAFKNYIVHQLAVSVHQ